MIFCSKDEEGTPKWLKILEMKPTDVMVTRRLKPMVVGKTYAVCPNRGKKQVCRIKCLSVIRHPDWLSSFDSAEYFGYALVVETKLEGFNSVPNWFAWYKEHKIDINKTWRCEFEGVF